MDGRTSNGLNQRSRRMRADRSILVELIKVLTPHPGGLRRWSVMQAIRKDREHAAHEIPLQFEDEVERTFRRFCSDEKLPKTGTCTPDHTLFYRPKEKAGEVWAIYPDRVRAWLDARPSKPS